MQVLSTSEGESDSDDEAVTRQVESELASKQLAAARREKEEEAARKELQEMLDARSKSKPASADSPVKKDVSRRRLFFFLSFSV